jgi:hypothetical protein
MGSVFDQVGLRSCRPAGPEKPLTPEASELCRLRRGVAAAKVDPEAAKEARADAERVSSAEGSD